MSQARTRPWIALGAIAVAEAIVAYLSLGSIGINLHLLLGCSPAA